MKAYVATIKVIVPAENSQQAFNKLTLAAQVSQFLDWGFIASDERVNLHPVKLPDNFLELKSAAASEQQVLTEAASNGIEIPPDAAYLQEEYRRLFDKL